MNKIFLAILVFLFVFGVNFAHAESLNEINTIVSEYDEISATVEILWNHDETVTKYEIGCVSCSPNFSNNTIDDEIVLQNITSLESGFAVFYVIAFNADDREIITVKQVMLELHYPQN